MQITHRTNFAKLITHPAHTCSQPTPKPNASASDKNRNTSQERIQQALPLRAHIAIGKRTYDSLAPNKLRPDRPEPPPAIAYSEQQPAVAMRQSGNTSRVNKQGTPERLTPSSRFTAPTSRFTSLLAQIICRVTLL